MEILTQAFYKALEKKISESQDLPCVEKLTDDIEKLLPNISKPLKESILANAKKTIDERRKLSEEFCKRNYDRWQDAFDLLEICVILCTEVGENFNKTYRPTAVKQQDIVFDVLIRHHARACHIGQEILCLLKAGFPDGAHARWRALHEVTATAIFIAKHGERCAERFYWHDIIDSYKGMLQHKKYEHRLQAKGPTEKEFTECKELYDKLLDTYGKDFKKPYG